MVAHLTIFVEKEMSCPPPPHAKKNNVTFFNHKLDATYSQKGKNLFAIL